MMKKFVLALFVSVSSICLPCSAQQKSQQSIPSLLTKNPDGTVSFNPKEVVVEIRKQKSDLDQIIVRFEDPKNSIEDLTITSYELVLQIALIKKTQQLLSGGLKTLSNMKGDMDVALQAGMISPERHKETLEIIDEIKDFFNYPDNLMWDKIANSILKVGPQPTKAKPRVSVPEVFLLAFIYKTLYSFKRR